MNREETIQRFLSNPGPVPEALTLIVTTRGASYSVTLVLGFVSTSFVETGLFNTAVALREALRL